MLCRLPLCIRTCLCITFIPRITGMTVSIACIGYFNNLRLRDIVTTIIISLSMMISIFYKPAIITLIGCRKYRPLCSFARRPGTKVVAVFLVTTLDDRVRRTRITTSYGVVMTMCGRYIPRMSKSSRFCIVGRRYVLLYFFF